MKYLTRTAFAALTVAALGTAASATDLRLSHQWSGNDVRNKIAEMVAALEASRQMVYWAATCKDQGADVYVGETFDIVVIDGIHAAGEGTAHTLGADATSQAAGGLGLGAFVVVATLHFYEVVYPFLNRQFRQRYPWLPPDLASGQTLSYFGP